MARTKQTKAQTTIVSVAVTTAGPVPMKAIREWVAEELDKWGVWEQDNLEIVRVKVKRDAHIERPNERVRMSQLDM